VIDLYVISTYYQSDELVGQGHALLAMVSSSIFCQILVTLAAMQKKSWVVKLREVLITIFFLRPVLDAYRVSTNHEDDEATVDTMSQMMMCKAYELSAESIPGCVLQIYVWFQNSEKAGEHALLSIAISALTTGYTSAMISFDLDVDVPHRNDFTGK